MKAAVRSAKAAMRHLRALVSRWKRSGRKRIEEAMKRARK